MTDPQDMPARATWKLLARFEETLQKYSQQPIRLRWHQNRHTMIRISALRPLGWRISLHREFGLAPLEVQSALASYLNTQDQDAWAQVRHYAEGIPISPRGDAIQCKTDGTWHNLGAIQKKIESQYFNGQSLAKISWKTFRKSRTRRKRRSIRFGQYDPVENLIWINDLLDQAYVPASFVEFIVYHETLHAVHPPIRQGKKTVYHHAAFRKQEKDFPNYDHMQTMSERLLHLLDKAEPRPINFLRRRGEDR